MPTTLDVLKSLGGVFLDPWVAVDNGGAIVSCNAHFRALFSKALARRMRGAPLEHYVTLESAGEDLDITAVALERGSAVRYDEVIGYVTDGANLSLIVSATPLPEGDGVLVMMRDITDLARIQAKYRQLTSS